MDDPLKEKNSNSSDISRMEEESVSQSASQSVRASGRKKFNLMYDKKNDQNLNIKHIDRFISYQIFEQT